MSEDMKAPFARRGLQIVPITRVGWIATGAYVAIVAGGSLAIAALTPADGVVIGWSALVLASAIAFTAWAWRMAETVAPPLHRDADYWFVPKLFGFGATPVTWQGWALTLGMVALMILDARFVEPSLVKVVVAIGVIVGYIAIAAHKTPGGWHWRWGPGD